VLTRSIRTFNFVSTNEPSTRHSTSDRVSAQHYEIRVSGHLGSRWSAWFDGMTLTPDNDGTSVISGFVVDQAALHGLLQKLRDLGIPLISLTPLAPETAAEHPHETRKQTQHHSPGATS
jgi:hypothetical protein